MPPSAREGALVTSAHYNPVLGFWIPAFGAAFVYCVLVVGRPPEVELRACWPFDVRGSATWAGVAAELALARCTFEEGSCFCGHALVDGLGWTGRPAQKDIGEKGPGNRQRTSHVGAVEEWPESGRKD
ncbi:hypothetical protein NDU88_005845 [Pleurodeles waltl]|uniref:Uncharacterized protein n=1 Tax=Pleurodeles waltl TaxID=8319 RepID=A0AAV7LYF8_PLEWA|nr:hypothetical protein NDU88_005845 [Pleurodeles waltl]